MAKGMEDGGTWLLLGRRVDKRLLFSCVIAQGLSFLLCITGITSTVLSQRSINAPATQSLVNYALLAVTCTAIHWYQQGWQWRTSNKWYIYLLLAFLDVEANFLVTKAYQYTSITSVTLLDCFTVPAVMLLSYFVLRSRYAVGHLLGALLCVLGLTLLVLTDSLYDAAGPHALLGDVLVICGACVYAVCNVAQEHLLVRTSQWELLGCLGCFGTLIGGMQAAVLEHGAWTSGLWDGAAVAALLGFAAALYTFSLLLPLVLRWGGSTVLNLSLLTSDLWAAGARALLFGGFGGTGGFFAAAVVAEVAGIGLYTLSGSTHARAHSHTPAHSHTGPSTMRSSLCEQGEAGEGLGSFGRYHEYHDGRRSLASAASSDGGHPHGGGNESHGSGEHRYDEREGEGDERALLLPRARTSHEQPSQPDHSLAVQHHQHLHHHRQQQHPQQQQQLQQQHQLEEVQHGSHEDGGVGQEETVRLLPQAHGVFDVMSSPDTPGALSQVTVLRHGPGG